MNLKKQIETAILKNDNLHLSFERDSGTHHIPFNIQKGVNGEDGWQTLVTGAMDWEADEDGDIVCQITELLRFYMDEFETVTSYFSLASHTQPSPEDRF